MQNIGNTGSLDYVGDQKFRTMPAQVIEKYPKVETQSLGFFKAVRNARTGEC